MRQMSHNLPIIQRTILATLLQSLNPSKLATYDLHYSQVIQAIKTGDRDTIERFYKHYEIDENHPLKLIVEDLINPVENVVSSALVKPYFFNGFLAGYTDDNGQDHPIVIDGSSFITYHAYNDFFYRILNSKNSDNTDHENILEFIP